MTKRWFILLIGLASTLGATAQSISLSCSEAADFQSVLTFLQTNRTKTEVVTGLAADKARRRLMNQDFASYMRKIAEPTTISPVASKTWNVADYTKKLFILDADIQVPIAIGGRRFGLNSLQVIPRFKVRIFQNDLNVPMYPDSSLAVRTPSYMPGAVHYFTFRRLWRIDETPQTLVDRLLSNKYFGIAAFHHSDGQDGPEFYTLDPNRVNVYNGNFGEQLVFEFIVGGRKKYPTQDLLVSNRNKITADLGGAAVGDAITIRTGIRQESSWRVGVEEHFKPLTNQKFLQYNMYGRHRLNLLITHIIAPAFVELVRHSDQSGTDKFCMLRPEMSYETWRILVSATYIMDKDYNRGTLDDLRSIGILDLSRRLNLYVAAHRVLGWSKYASVFVQAGYFGSDAYNIYFNQSIWQVKAGVGLAFFDQPDVSVH